ncbi:hypothetical protein OF83DRAFT_1088565, partial [Amylostereum chailletii]
DSDEFVRELETFTHDIDHLRTRSPEDFDEKRADKREPDDSKNQERARKEIQDVLGTLNNNWLPRPRRKTVIRPPASPPFPPQHLASLRIDTPFPNFVYHSTPTCSTSTRSRKFALNFPLVPFAPQGMAVTQHQVVPSRFATRASPDVSLTPPVWPPVRDANLVEGVDADVPPQDRLSPIAVRTIADYRNGILVHNQSNAVHDPDLIVLESVNTVILAFDRFLDHGNTVDAYDAALQDPEFIRVRKHVERFVMEDGREVDGQLVETTQLTGDLFVRYLCVREGSDGEARRNAPSGTLAEDTSDDGGYAELGLPTPGLMNQLDEANYLHRIRSRHPYTPDVPDYLSRDTQITFMKPDLPLTDISYQLAIADSTRASAERAPALYPSSVRHVAIAAEDGIWFHPQLAAPLPGNRFQRGWSFTRGKVESSDVGHANDLVLAGTGIFITTTEDPPPPVREIQMQDGTKTPANGATCIGNIRSSSVVSDDSSFDRRSAPGDLTGERTGVRPPSPFPLVRSDQDPRSPRPITTSPFALVRWLQSLGRWTPGSSATSESDQDYPPARPFGRPKMLLRPRTTLDTPDSSSPSQPSTPEVRPHDAHSLWCRAPNIPGNPLYVGPRAKFFDDAEKGGQFPLIEMPEDVFSMVSICDSSQPWWQRFESDPAYRDEMLTYVFRLASALNRPILLNPQHHLTIKKETPELTWPSSADLDDCPFKISQDLDSDSMSPPSSPEPLPPAKPPGVAEFCMEDGMPAFKLDGMVLQGRIHILVQDPALTSFIEEPRGAQNDSPKSTRKSPSPSSVASSHVTSVSSPSVSPISVSPAPAGSTAPPLPREPRTEDALVEIRMDTTEDFGPEDGEVIETSPPPDDDDDPSGGGVRLFSPIPRPSIGPAIAAQLERELSLSPPFAHVNQIQVEHAECATDKLPPPQLRDASRKFPPEEYLGLFAGWPFNLPPFPDPLDVGTSSVSQTSSSVESFRDRLAVATPLVAAPPVESRTAKEKETLEPTRASPSEEDNAPDPFAKLKQLSTTLTDDSLPSLVSVSSGSSPVDPITPPPSSASSDEPHKPARPVVARKTVPEWRQRPPVTCVSDSEDGSHGGSDESLAEVSFTYPINKKSLTGATIVKSPLLPKTIKKPDPSHFEELAAARRAQQRFVPASKLAMLADATTTTPHAQILAIRRQQVVQIIRAAVAFVEVLAALRSAHSHLVDVALPSMHCLSDALRQPALRSLRANRYYPYQSSFHRCAFLRAPEDRFLTTLFAFLKRHGTDALAEDILGLLGLRTPSDAIIAPLVQSGHLDGDGPPGGLGLYDRR